MRCLSVVNSFDFLHRAYGLLQCRTQVSAAVTAGVVWYIERRQMAWRKRRVLEQSSSVRSASHSSSAWRSVTSRGGRGLPTEHTQTHAFHDSNRATTPLTLREPPENIESGEPSVAKPRQLASTQHASRGAPERTRHLYCAPTPPHSVCPPALLCQLRAPSGRPRGCGTRT